MRLRTFSLGVLALVIPLLAVTARADILGSADTYAVLATGTVTNPTTNAATIVNGDMGAVSCTGFTVGCTFGPGMVSGATNLSNPPYTTALADSNKAYLALKNTPDTGGFTCLGLGLGCLNNVAPGVYDSTLSSTLLHGALVLDAGSNTDPIWIFQMAFGFTTDPNSSVSVIGAGAAAAGVYFEVGSQATLGDNSTLIGNVLAGTKVAFDPGAEITCGRAFTDTPAGTDVTFAGNNPASTVGVINKVSDTCTQSSSGFNGGVIVTPPGGGPGIVAAPEPGTFVLLLAGLLAIGLLMYRKPSGAKCGVVNSTPAAA